MARALGPARSWRHDFKKIGVKLNIQVVNDTTLNNDLYGNHYRNFQLAMWGWDAYIDPNFILSVVTCGQLGAESDSGYCNKKYDALFKQQAATMNVAARQSIVYQMQQMIFDATAVHHPRVRQRARGMEQEVVRRPHLTGWLRNLLLEGPDRAGPAVLDLTGRLTSQASSGRGGASFGSYQSPPPSSPPSTISV